MRFDFSILKKPVQNIYRNIYSKSKRSPVESFLETSFVFDGNKIMLFSNNEQVGLKYFIDADFVECEFNIDTNILHKIVSTFNDVDVDIKDDVLIIKDGRKKIKFKLKPIIENLFLSNDVIKNSLKSEIDFSYYTKLISPFTSKEKFDNVLAGIYFSKEFIVGTDRNVLCYIDVKNDVPDAGLLIPPYDFENVNYEFYYDENWLLFKQIADNYEEYIYHRTLANPLKYPNVKTVIDNSRNNYIIFNREEIVNIIKDIRNLYGGNSDFFSIRIKDGEAILRAYDLYSSQNEFESTINIDTDISMGYYGFNIDFFLKVINISDEENVKLEFNYNQDSSPFIYTYNNIKSLIMPMRLSDL